MSPRLSATERFPHGVHVGETRAIDSEAARRQFGYDPGDVIVAEPGYVRRQKGTHSFVDVAAALPEYEFLVAGGPQPQNEGSEPYLDELRERAGENVRFTGHLPDERFHAAFVAADLVCLPYLRMTQSGIFNWCAAYGTPVVAADHAFFRRLAHEWDCVLTFDAGDTDDAATTVRRVLNDPDRRAGLSQSLAAYREDNSFVAVGRRHRRLYRDLLG